MDRRNASLGRIRALLIFFMAALAVSGLTAVPLQWELDAAASMLGVAPDTSAANYTGLAHWIATVRDGIRQTNAQYPFMAYGTDWLAFAHVVIAILFIGPVRDPVRNAWVIDFGLIACVLVVPWSFCFGALRGIPLYWQLIDCSFGVFGFVPLWIVRRLTQRLAADNGSRP